jgi:hypothetical protein
MNNTIKYYVDAEEGQYDYNVDGDENALLLRNKRDVASIPNTIDSYEVSPVSANSPPRFPYRDFRLELEILLSVGLIYCILLFIAMCCERCCGRRLQELETRRREARLRQLRAEALRRWPGRPHAASVTLRSLSTRATLNHLRSPVTRNVQKLNLPKVLRDELIDQRRNGHPIVTVQDHRAARL